MGEWESALLIQWVLLWPSTTERSVGSINRAALSRCLALMPAKLGQSASLICAGGEWTHPNDACGWLMTLAGGAVTLIHPSVGPSVRPPSSASPHSDLRMSKLDVATTSLEFSDAKLAKQRRVHAVPSMGQSYQRLYQIWLQDGRSKARLSRDLPLCQIPIPRPQSWKRRAILGD